jgi:DNA-binding XRE family transcriptional regulator
MISAAQCRAARAMLTWSQDELATNAQVSRATIADFERQGREPIRNNLFSIISAFEASGIAFIQDDDLGSGVRFATPKLEYVNSVRAAGGDVVIPMRYVGRKFAAIITRNAIDDFDQTTYSSGEDRVKAVERNFPIYLRAIERMVQREGANLEEKLIVTYDEIEAYRNECLG